MNIVFNDETKMEGYYGYASGHLWCHLDPCTIATSAEIFLDSNKTSSISFFHDEVKDVFHGFTTLIILKTNDRGTGVDAMLYGENTSTDWDVPIAEVISEAQP